MLTTFDSLNLQLRAGAADSMRRFVVVAVLAVSTAKSLASDIGGVPPLVPDGGPSFEQIVSTSTGPAVQGLARGLPSMNDVDSVFLGARAAPEVALDTEVQALIARASTEDRPMQETQPDQGQNRPADSRNSTVIHASARDAAMVDPAPVASKGDLVSALEVKSNLTVSFGDADSLHDNREEKLRFMVFSFEMPGVAATILFALWSLLAAVVVLVHYEQKTERRRDITTWQRVSRKSVQPAMKPAHLAERALQAQPDAHPARVWKMKDQTANSNTAPGAVHAA
jgi:hypothetical protein